MVFASTYKVYVGFSARRFTSDLREAYAGGLIDSTPHFNSVNRYLANPDLTGVLKELVTLSSLPLKSVETDFGASVRGKSDVAQVNEVLVKVLCHNICVPILATRELGIEAAFGSKRTFGSESQLEPKLFF